VALTSAESSLHSPLPAALAGPLLTPLFARACQCLTEKMMTQHPTKASAQIMPFPNLVDSGGTSNSGKVLGLIMYGLPPISSRSPRYIPFNTTHRLSRLYRVVKILLGTICAPRR
jgi:hypothetical protein